MTKAPGAAEAALDRLFSGWAPPVALGLAVSGGGDSMALLALVAERAPPGLRKAVVTVDHGLRPEAREEAALVARTAAQLGIPHHILRWSPEGRRGNLQAAAREARMCLIADWARSQHIGTVALAHTLDDQAETVLMRLARGSGVDGLSAMTPTREAVGITWLRPFLDIPRAALRDALIERGIDWAEDPSNRDPRFHRVRARAALEALAPLGIDARGLAATAARLQQAREALEAETLRELEKYAKDDRGMVLLDRTALSLPDEIRDRLIALLLRALTGASHRPRLAALHRWIDAADGQGAMLGGARIQRDGQMLRLFREAQAVASLRVASDAVWDGRWRAIAPPGAPPGQIAALGAAGLRQLSRQAAQGLHPHWRDTGLPQAALEATPAIWRGEALVAAPVALWPEGWAFDLRPAAAASPTGTIRIE